MNESQAFRLEKLVEQLRVGNGELMRLAREVAHDARLLSLADLTSAQCDELIDRLQLVAA